MEQGTPYTIQEITEIENTVNERFQEATDYADESFELVSDFLQDIVNDFEEMIPPTTDIPYDFPEIAIDSDITATKPEVPDTTFVPPPLPSVPVLQSLALGDLPSLPTLTATSPTLNIPSAPSAVLPPDPGDPPVQTEISLPPDPVLADIPEPIVYDIVFPAAPVLTIPSFDGVRPVDNLVVPDLSFNFSEAMYDSALIQELKTKILLNIQNGGTGLDPDVEQAIFDRAKDKQELENERVYTEAEQYYAARGFTLPPGALGQRLLQAVIEITRANAALNQDIMIKQADLAQTNTHFMYQQAIALEAIIMDYTNKMVQRAFEGEKISIDVALNMYNALLEKYKSSIQMYGMDVEVYKAKIQASTLEIEGYKALLEGLRIQADVQQILVNIYVARLSAQELQYKIYQAQLQGKSLLLELDKLKLDSFKTKVEVYTAKINAKTAEFNMYQSRIAGEQAKATAYGEQVKAFAYETEAYKTAVDAEVASLTAKIESNKALTQEYIAEIEQYKAEVDGETERLKSVAAVYGYQIEGYKADVSAQVAEIDAQIKTYDVMIQKANNMTTLLLKEAEIDINEFIELNKLRLEASKDAATIGAQIAASALSTISAHAQMSAGADVGLHSDYQHREGVDVGYSFAHSYEEAPGSGSAPPDLVE
jgi:hypothetical protein